MKAIKTILKIVSALIFVAGAVYVVAAYGDKIVAWAKKLLSGCGCCKGVVETPIEDADAEEASVEEVPVEEPTVEEAPAEEPAAEEAPADDAVVATDADFEG